ncbi:MAG TPA: hypothetical protein VMF51_19815 [Nocardioides sp.]|uniref:hypothetical protein n=1 Tax=Nocardioides sp. TaxID=35761 RepID=UPI002C2908FB|nr:hypothetical protein [Nocardioides sp.]HTW17383.1 hypothetical protein [Nocardioides sp.]
MINEMNPGSFSFGPLWWALFIAIAAFAVVGVMILFLWQASKESAPRAAREVEKAQAGDDEVLAPVTPLIARPTP